MSEVKSGIYYQSVGFVFLQSASDAQPELVDLRLPDREHHRAHTLRPPHLPLHLPGQGTETRVGNQIICKYLVPHL